VNDGRSDSIQGRLLNLEARSVQSRIWLGPGWALLCGAVGSAGLDISWHTLISLLLGLLLVDSLLGTVWSLVMAHGSVLATGGEGNPGEKANFSAPPYTLPGSFGYRFFRLLSERASSWRSALSSAVGSPLLTLVFNSLFALVMGALLGEGPLLLTVLALLVAVSLLALSPSQDATRLALGSFFLAGLAWLMGYAIFHNLAALSSDRSLIGKPLLWASIYAAAFHGYQLVSKESLTKGATLLDLAQLASIALLVIVKQPILAGIAALLLLPQMLLQPSLLSTGDGLWYLRRVQVFTMAAMMVTAVAAAM
jgi:hypothetical protein